MSYNYCFCNAEGSLIQRTDKKGDLSFIPCLSGNREYEEYLASGVTASAFVPPPAPKLPTPAEKLAAAGISIDELKELLGL